MQEDSSLSSASNGGSRSCAMCGTALAASVFLCCAVCVNTDICVACFTRGREKSTHSNTHPYRVVDNGKFPLFDPEWGAHEELKLLDAIGRHGLGNWTAVGSHVGTKTAQQCSHHYQSTYVNTPTAPLPDMGINLSGPTPASQSHNLSRNDQQLSRVSQVGAPMAEAAGYMQLREDFEVEPYNDAERLIEDITFQTDDSALDRELKLTMVHIYNRMLDRREECKKIVLEHRLVEVSKQKGAERVLAKDEQEIRDTLRPFARLQSLGEHEALTQGLLLERHIRQRIQQLQRHRRNGVQSLHDGEVFELLLARRQADKGLKRQGRRVSAYIAKRNAGESEVNPNELTVGGKKRVATPLNLDGAQDVDLLSLAEKELCCQLRLYPVQYLAIKAILVNEYLERGHIKLAQARSLVRIDVNKTRRIYNHLVETGLINRTQPV